MRACRMCRKPLANGGLCVKCQREARSILSSTIDPAKQRRGDASYYSALARRGWSKRSLTVEQRKAIGARLTKSRKRAAAAREAQS